MTQETLVLGEGELAPEILAAANINPTTGLATDYLNHFNEVVMLMEMLGDMPDCAEDVLDWKPASYPQHFEHSTFKDKQLAILAYRAAPRDLRLHLETIILQLDRTVINAQSIIRENEVDQATGERLARIASHDVRPLIAAASGAIHGHIDASLDLGESTQADIDAVFTQG